MSTEVLSRLQFALTASFHFLFPPMSIGLGLMLVAIQGLRLWRGKQLYVDMARLWTRASGSSSPSALPRVSRWSFSSGLTGRYARFVGDIFGSPLAIEDIYAFFLESGFLALLLFGWHKIGHPMHFFSTCMVALGTLFSAIWILVANSTEASANLLQSVKNLKRVIN